MADPLASKPDPGLNPSSTATTNPYDLSAAALRIANERSLMCETRTQLVLTSLARGLGA